MSSPSSRSPRLPSSPTGELSDTLSPLRERFDPGPSTSPRSSPSVARAHTPTFSHSPERSPLMNTSTLQKRCAYARHPSPNSSPLAQGIPLPNHSPLLSSSPELGLSQSPMSQSPRPASPASTGITQGSPASVHSTRSQFQHHPPGSPPLPTQSYFYPSQNSPIPSSRSRYPRPQSLIQQSFGNPHVAQVAFSPDDPHNRRVSLGAVVQHPSPRSSPIPASQDIPAMVSGDSTPLNEAPIHWWGGQKDWVDDWDNVAQQSKSYNSYAARGEFRGTMGMEFIQPGYGNPSAFREPFGRGSGMFLDEEVRASFDGVGGVGAGCADPPIPGRIPAPVGNGAGYGTEGMPAPCSVFVPFAHRPTESRVWNDSLGYGEVDAGLPPTEGSFAVRNMPDNSPHRRSYYVHLHGDARGLTPDGTVSVGQGPGSGGQEGSELVGQRSRRFSDASTHSSSYLSCISGPSQSQSQSLLASSSQSYTNTYPSLNSLGIGIEAAEREEHRSKSFWARKSPASATKRQSKDLSHGRSNDVDEKHQSPRLVKSGLARMDDPEGERAGDVKTGGAMQCPDPNSKQSATHARDKDTAKHGSLFFRGSSKHADVPDEQAQRQGYERAEKCVSLAITSILPATTITMLSPAGEALVRAKESVKFVGLELAPVIKDTLSISTDILSLAPLPGLEEAAKALLSVWEACQKVDTNRLACLRLAERCATLLYSVRCEIDEAGVETSLALAEPVQRLCGALVQIRTFLETQLHRPFLKRYVRREEISRELVACNEAITDAASRFGISVQVRTYHAVCLAASESRRLAQEAQVLLSLDHRMFQQYAMMLEQRVHPRRNEVAAGFPGDNALGLTIDDAAVNTNGCQSGTVNGGERLTPPPAYGPPTIAAPSPMAKPMLTEFGTGQITPTLSTLPIWHGSDVTDSIASAPPTPTPTRTMLFVEETKTSTTTTAMLETEKVTSHPVSPMRALVEVHRAQDSVDATVDEAALRGTLAGALDAGNDVEMVRCLQVARAEIPEAAETLRRMLHESVEGNQRFSGREEHAMNMGNTELDRRFMQSGIEAMTRLTNGIVKQPRDEELRLGPGVGTPELPSWTITRYEVIRTRKIGAGFFSDVYHGIWRRRTVVIKVLAHSVSRDAFVRHIELWHALDHPNVLPLYGASSTVGEKPWFFVSKFCSGDNLVASLKRARATGAVYVGNKTVVRLDPLRCMLEIARGMAYLHECGVLHGDLRAANVLVDENGRCVLSDFSQYDIKSEARRSCGQAVPHPIRWRAPEMLVGDDQPTIAADVHAFAVCCVEILGMGDLPWPTLDDKAIHELVLHENERPPIPVFAGSTGVVDAVTNLVRSCWVREPDRRPSFAHIVASIEDTWRLDGRGSPRLRHAPTPSIDIESASDSASESAEPSPADETYETAPESMVDEDNMDEMIDVSLASPGPALVNGSVGRSVVHVNACNHAEGMTVSTQILPGILDCLGKSMPSHLVVNAKNEEHYRLIVGSNHVFHNSLTLPLWSPTRVELGSVGYLSKPRGEFVTLFNAMDPLQSSEERLRQLPSMYGYGKFEVQKREDGKRNVAQRGLDAISVFLTFKTRGDRPHSERIARQYAFPLVQGKPSAHLCMEKTVHRYMDRLEAPTTWFKQHTDLILEVYASRHAIQREDLILVVGTLDAPDWAVFVSEDHPDGRAQFNVFAGREKGGPWGMYTMEQAVKGGNATPGQRADVDQGMFVSKVSCATLGGHEVAGDTVMLAGLRFERGAQTPTAMRRLGALSC